MRLETLLEYREIKADVIQSLVSSDTRTVLVIRVNIPGPDKRTRWALKLFDEAVRSVVGAFESQSIAYEDVTFRLEERVEPVEYVHILYVDLEPNDVKLRCVQIEESHSIGRIFDLDVYDEKGQSLTRAHLGMGIRKCYLCDRDDKIYLLSNFKYVLDVY